MGTSPKVLSSSTKTVCTTGSAACRLPNEDHVGPRAGEHGGHMGPRAGEHGGHMGPRAGGVVSCVLDLA